MTPQTVAGMVTILEKVRWTCPACGDFERWTRESADHHTAYLQSHLERCAVAEGFVPTDRSIRQMWRCLTAMRSVEEECPTILFSMRMRGGNGLAYCREKKKFCDVSVRSSPAIVLSTLIHEMNHHAVGLEAAHNYHFNFNLALTVAALWDIGIPGGEGLAPSYALDLALCARNLKLRK